MTDHPDLCEVRELPSDVTLELRAGDDPALELAQGKVRVRVELAPVKGVVAALVGAAADLAQGRAGTILEDMRRKREERE